MGLDITVYTNLKKVEGGEGIDQRYPEDREPLDGYAKFYVNPDFPGRADEIEDRAIYAADEEDSFRAGSYVGYNNWREKLARIAGYTPEECWNNPNKCKDLPFYELVNFSDCEGTLGTAVCKELAKDFEEFQDAATSFKDYESGYFHSLYIKWRSTFEVAAENNGAVAFH
jgi:hypothetical protein